MGTCNGSSVSNTTTISSKSTINNWHQDVGSIVDYIIYACHFQNYLSINKYTTGIRVSVNTSA